MFKLSLRDIHWQALPRLGVIILIMLVSSFLWYTSAAQAVTNPCVGPAVSASHQSGMCQPSDSSVTASGRWFQRTFGSILMNK